MSKSNKSAIASGHKPVMLTSEMRDKFWELEPISDEDLAEDKLSLDNNDGEEGLEDANNE